jgi:hypothetical protein
MPVPGGNYDETYYQNLFTSQWGAAAGTAYAAYNAAHPGSSPVANADAFAELVAVKGLGNAIASVTSATVSTEAGGIEGAALGAAHAAGYLSNPLDYLKSVAGFFEDLASGNLWLRIGEVVLGLILIAVGVAELTHAVPIATQVARTVGATAAVAA